MSMTEGIYTTLLELRDRLGSAWSALLDAPVSSRATPAQVNTEVHNRLNTSIPAVPVNGSLYERVKALDDAYTTAKAAYLDAAVSSRATPTDVYNQILNMLRSEALSPYPLQDSLYERIKTLDDNYTAARAASLDIIASSLDTTVSSRAPASTALTNATWTNTRAGKLDNLDAAVSTLAPASTALTNTVWTNTRAARLDDNITSRAPASTALTSATWTNARAAKLDNLDAAVSNQGKLQAQKFTTSGTFTVPANVSLVWLTLCGGGGGSGYTSSGSYKGGAGGGGEAVIRFPVPVTAGQNISVTVGAGGAGGTSTVIGANGGDSSFGTFIAAHGGGGGGSAGSGFSGASGDGGGLIGPLTLSNGSQAIVTSPYSITGAVGAGTQDLYGGSAGSFGPFVAYSGGASALGDGGAANSPGTGYGGGAGMRVSTAGNGYNGATGVVIVEWIA